MNRQIGFARNQKFTEPYGVLEGHTAGVNLVSLQMRNAGNLTFELWPRKEFMTNFWRLFTRRSRNLICDIQGAEAAKKSLLRKQKRIAKARAINIKTFRRAATREENRLHRVICHAFQTQSFFFFFPSIGEFSFGVSLVLWFPAIQPCDQVTPIFCYRLPSTTSSTS